MSDVYIIGEHQMMWRQYIQETGRAGRDGEPAEALLYVTTHPANRFVDDDMKEYSKNKDRCRRELLLKNFDGSMNF
jgi:superfamily II DNA helicase RecQ